MSQISIFIPKELTDLALEDTLRRFFDAMIYKLRLNSHKGRWEGQNLNMILAKLRDEVVEIEEAIEGGNALEIVLEAADVANFALIASAIAIEGKR